MISLKPVSSLGPGLLFQTATQVFKKNHHHGIDARKCPDPPAALPEECHLGGQYRAIHHEEIWEDWLAYRNTGVPPHSVPQHGEQGAGYNDQD